ncbi:hypothetical protein N9C83_06055 [Opitutales bacterium]|jgi:hypothetical protein|nr:hypothetical protein [Opitutales bacterium]
MPRFLGNFLAGLLLFFFATFFARLFNCVCLGFLSGGHFTRFLAVFFFKGFRSVRLLEDLFLDRMSSIFKMIGMYSY